MAEDIAAINYLIKEAPVGELYLIIRDIEQLRGNKDFMNIPEVL